MAMKSKKRAVGVLTPKEFAVVEAQLFGSELLQAAYLLDNGICQDFIKASAAELREARTATELAERCVEIWSSAKRYSGWGLGLGGLSDKAEKVKIEKIQARETALQIESERLRAEALPCFYDRWIDCWVDKASWRPVPGVDRPDLQVFHTSLSGAKA